MLLKWSKDVLAVAGMHKSFILLTALWMPVRSGDITKGWG